MKLIIDGSKIVLVNCSERCKLTCYFPQRRLKRISNPVRLWQPARGGAFNCTISTLDKKKVVDRLTTKKASLNKLQLLIKTHNLLDSWRFNNLDQAGFTWANPSMKIQCRRTWLLPCFKAAKRPCGVKYFQIIIIHITQPSPSPCVLTDESELPWGPGCWKFTEILALWY